jgi:hypothetical protein
MKSSSTQNDEEPAVCALPDEQIHRFHFVNLLVKRSTRNGSWTRPSRLSSGGLIGCVAFLPQMVKVIEARKVNVHAGFVKITSGQLPFLG